MSSFDKLTILGIRSFGPNEEDKGVIKFSTPLTLILGENGCGKTTIIEALKYACCGETPSNTDRGSGWIYDPKLTHFSESKAQVNLKLKDINGEEMSVIKLASATQKLKNNQFKTLDQTINRRSKTGGGWVSISHKCADIDAEMSIALGVQKAILSNVLLCHQEDSNWPLEKDAIVKEKFDAIFGAVRYNQCLDHIKKLRKNIMEEIKIKKTDVHYLREYKKEAGDKRAKLTDTEIRMTQYKEEISSYKNKLLPIQGRMTELIELEDKISELHTKRETEKAKLEGVRNLISENRKNISTEFKGSTQELELAILNFQQELGGKNDNLESLERRSEEVLVEINRNLQLIGEEQVKIGTLTRDLEKYKERVEARNNALVALSNQLNIGTTFSELSESDEVERVLSRVDEEIIKCSDNVTALKEEQNANVAKLQKEIDNLREDRAKLEQSIENKQINLRQNKNDLIKVKADIYEVDQSTDLLGQLQTKLERVKKELDDIIKNNEIEKIQNDIKSAEEERDNLEDSLSHLEREIQNLQLQSSAQTKLDMQCKSRDAAEAEVVKLRNRHKEALKHLLGEMPESGIKMQLDACVDKLTDDIKSKNELIKMRENEIITLEAERKHLIEKVRSTKHTLESDEFAIQKACGGRDYEEYLTELSNKVQELQDEKGTLSSSEFMSKRYIQSLQQEKPSCPLCHRHFPAEDEVTTLISELSLKVREIPSRLRSNRDILADTQEKYKHLLQLKPRYDKLSSIKSTEIPKLQSELSQIERKLSAAKETLSELRSQVEVPEADEAIAKGIQSDVVLLEQNLLEVRRLGREIQKLEASMPPGSKRSLEEALQEQKDMRSAALSSRRSLEALQSRRLKVTEKRNKLQEEKNSIQNQQLKISGNSQMRSQLVERRDELESLEVMLQMEIDKGTEDLGSVNRHLDQVSRQMKTLQTSNAAKLEEQTHKVRKLERRHEEVKSEQRAISQYEMSGGTRRLESAHQNLATLQRKGDGLQAKKDLISDEREQLKSYLTTQTARQKELDENLKLRQRLELEKTLIQNIGVLKEKLGDLDFSKLNKEKTKLKKDEDKINEEISFAEGRMRELKNIMRNLEEELNIEKFKSADKNYRDKVIEIEVAEQSASDLNNYYTAFDNAIMTYHKNRMDQINKVIHELWRKIYSGNDIDTIKIATEQEGSSADKRKAHKYRVVQVKNGTELDMRGRCSAGQKVLACLIIRMALAETFSSKCGILALDEPTTNLDQRNIINLCSAIEELVRYHSQKKNFQLVVITHDQHFLNILSRFEHIDHYFKLSRNSVGKSVVVKVNLID